MKRAYLGIDAHKEQNTIALAFAGRGDPELYGKAPADLAAFERVLRRVLEKYGLTKEDVAICYEAGPTGFVLCRRLRAMGFECEVVAPSLIPVKASDRVKTDRRDARKLAGLFRAGELTFVNVPDVADEMARLLPDWHRRKFVEALQGFRGFQLVAAMTLGSELGDLLRFDHPRRLMAYIGLVPGENSNVAVQTGGALWRR